MALNPTDDELMDLAAEEALKRTFTALTGRVTEYDATTRTATVQPLTQRAIEREDGSLALEDLPPLPSVPVMFPMSGPFSITFPIEVGTTGLILVLSDSDHIWRETQLTKPSEPGDLRRFSLSCTKFLPGYTPDAVANPAAAVAALVVKGADVRLGDETATDAVALAPGTNARLDAIESWLASHVHGGVTTGSGSTAAAPGAPSGSSPGATKVKAK